MEPQLPALKGEVLTTGPPGKSLTDTFKDSFNNRKTNRISHVTVVSAQYERETTGLWGMLAFSLDLWLWACVVSKVKGWNSVSA